MMRLFKFSTLFILLLMSIFVTSAKGIFPLVIITDTQTQKTLEITYDDSTVLTQFFIFDWRFGELKNIPEVENGYEIQRGGLLEGIFEPFDKLVYYPTETGHGYIHYIGLVDAEGNKDGASEYDNRWFKVDVIAEIHLKHILFDDAPSEAVPSNTSLWLESLFSIFHYQ